MNTNIKNAIVEFVEHNDSSKLINHLKDEFKNKLNNNSDYTSLIETVTKLSYTSILEILCNDFIDYIKTKFAVSFKTTIKFKKMKNKNEFGYVSLDMIKGKTYIINVDKDAGVKYTFLMIAHEITHCIQHVKGFLKYHNDTILYKDYSIALSDYNSLSYSEYEKIPFEKEAIKNSDTLPDDYIKNNIQKLKGKNNTLDFIIDNL